MKRIFCILLTALTLFALLAPANSLPPEPFFACFVNFL